MKKLLVILLIFFGLITVGCSMFRQSSNDSPDNQNTNESDNNVGLANPASVNCEEQGGLLQIRSNQDGEYGVCIFPDGSQCEEWAFFRGECQPGQPPAAIGQEDSQAIAKLWIEKNAQTYVFDGSDLKYQRSVEVDCPGCYGFVYTFTSSQAGYGDRSDQMMAQVITPHEIEIFLKEGRVVSAIVDGKFNEINQTLIDGDQD